MKVFQFLILVLVSIFISYCSSDSKPDVVLSEDEMVAIITKIHLSEAKIANTYVRSDSVLYYYKTMEDSIFIKANTTKIIYLQNYQHYMKNIEKMDKIYSRVIDSLSLRESIKNIKY